MTICGACGKDFRKTKSLTLMDCPELCESCFEYIILDENNHAEHIDEYFIDEEE